MQPVNKIKVTIRSKKGIHFDGMVSHVSSTNDIGDFDILPLHANFVTIMKNFVIVDKGLPTEKKFDLEKGVLVVRQNRVDVYLDLKLNFE